MENLNNQTCDACRVGAPQVSNDEIKIYKPQIPNWEIVEEEGIKKLQRLYTFGNFIDALGFTNKIALVAEQENHHPRIVTEWGKVIVTWWTHKIKGLHRNDFIMAAKSDALYK